jgi:hypothetical protein
MTKVEELRDKIYTKAAAHIGILESEFSCSPDENRTYEELTRELATDLYALISAAHAEGVAEERERILAYVDDSNNPCSLWRECWGFFLKRDSLSAFIKGGKKWVNERYPNYYAVGDNGESGESHSAASSGGYWKATYVPPPEMTFGPAGALLAPKEREMDREEYDLKRKP